MTQKALLIGINTYHGCPLNGCVADVRDMANTLFSLGVVPNSQQNMRIITDEKATKTAILKGLLWLVDGAQKGDLLIWFYSGHGTYVTDQNRDESDKKDECIVPVDYDYRGFIIDDEIAGILKTVPEGVTCEVFLDSCFSGSATRSLPMKTVRFLPPPLDHSFFVDTKPDIETKPFGKQLLNVPTMKHVLWSACKSNQTSEELEIDGEIRGAFTYTFCKCLRGSGLDVTRRKLSGQVSHDMKGSGYDQVPMLESNLKEKDERIFT